MLRYYREEASVPEQLLRTEEARKRTGMGKTKWREMMRADAFPIMRMNRRYWLIREAALDEWIARGCPVPPGVRVTERAKAHRTKTSEYTNGDGALTRRTVKAKEPRKPKMRDGGQ